MAEQTYMIRMEDENNLSTNEIILQSQPFITQAAVMAVMNNYKSNCVVRVKDVQFNEIQGRTGTTITNLNYYRITAHAGGEVITPIAHDSTASLPSQVVAYKYPRSVTTTGNPIRRQLSLYSNSMTGALQAFASVDGSMRAGGLNCNHDYRCIDTNTQPIVLREGEGLAIRTTLTMHTNYPMEFKLHITDGTNSWMITDVITASSHAEFFSIMNGSGSGVVIRVCRASIKQINDISALREYNIQSCIEVHDGTSITPVKLDSNNLEPDTLLDFKKNCLVTQGNKFALIGRSGGDINPWRRAVMPSFGTGVALANDLRTIMPKNFSIYSSQKNKSFSQIALREGEGFCILSKNFSYFGRYEIIILFTIDDSGDSGGSGGEHSYTF